MKKFLLKAFMLLCLILWGGVSSAWATTVTKKISDVVSENSYTVSSGSTINTKCTSIDLDANINVSVAVKDGATGNTGTFWGTSPNIDWRLYQADEPTITVSAADGYTISTVKFTYSNSNTGVINTSGHGQSISSTYQITSGTAYNVNAASATYYVGNTSTKTNGQARITAIEVVYSSNEDGGDSGDDDPENTLTINIEKLTNPNTTTTITYGTYNWTSGIVSGVYNGASSKNNSSFQFNYSASGSANYRDKQAVYNTVAVPGKITSIKMVTASGSNRTWTPYVSTSAITPANYSSATALSAKTVNSGEGTTWEVTGNNTYFYLNYTTGSASYIGDIVITYETEPTSTDVTISAAGYATFFDATHAVTLPEGVTGYVFTADDGLQSAYGTKESDKVVPAGEPLVLGGAADTYTLSYTTSTEVTWKSIEMNDLDGTDAETELTPDDSYYFYGLSLNASSELSSVGFYWMAADGAAFTNGAHKAYLKLPKSMFAEAEARSGFAFNEDTEALESIEMNAATTIYTLNGVKVNELQKGLNIVNGKKVMVK